MQHLDESYKHAVCSKQEIKNSYRFIPIILKSKSGKTTLFFRDA